MPDETCTQRERLAGRKAFCSDPSRHAPGAPATTVLDQISAASGEHPGGQRRQGGDEGGLSLLPQPACDRPIVFCHFIATAARVAANDGQILILQDTTEFIYRRAGRR